MKLLTGNSNKNLSKKTISIAQDDRIIKNKMIMVEIYH